MYIFILTEPTGGKYITIWSYSIDKLPWQNFLFGNNKPYIHVKPIIVNGVGIEDLIRCSKKQSMYTTTTTQREKQK
ncbi:unnamed protein product [Rhizophagus irregularis]|nr:unnamed protein product [Rhizophagus irregularis]CAB4407085.1 unnamed protein product [Rhizophagus irregularis]